ncbi:MAG: DUF2383 domain-containing protein [Pseudotabrizicola sp.]|uniref:DUF2383 domain-containing protein n=1 Tax=Pseudotabrizicola sp. TaxID=2939647 RepID=UPI00271E7899|nr:DUF2383 domain-containing protein [Pseudotabrizicola sp.]MDO8883812.1 DUF2383 domain-containing protein [Pseudotabrizicola sp.]MDP2079767.1 DUF2383 domain-containing protein [Pseudotabrizicola sp.]MDZ7574768.1 DUF2383 domain-containing protein [Pseudotabrizicola sp.]
MLTPTTAAMMLDTEESEAPYAAPDADDALLTLQRRTADALAGYVTMVDKAEPAFRPVAERFRALHDRHNAALTAILIRHGVEPDADGSFMGTVNKAVVSLRALFDDIDADVMDSIRDGENHVLEAFDAAITAVGMPPADVTELREMRDELTVLLQDTRHLD